MILVTGGAGFIGSNFIRGWRSRHDEPVVNLDALTYAGSTASLAGLAALTDYHFVQGDVRDRALVASLLARYQPRAIVHFAAETHVDRSIEGPEAFAQTNVLGTLSLLQESLRYWQSLSEAARATFRYLQVSTDEVYGSLDTGEAAFSETSPFEPNSPYAASKAAADHFVRAFNRTYGLPTLTTHCSNNYGPYQFPEKLIPLMIRNALAGEALPVYGDGQQVRDWLYVADHCEALERTLSAGQPGGSYAIGGHNEVRNLDLVQTLCEFLDEIRPRSHPYAGLVRFVADRPGHDRRYAIDATRAANELGWTPRKNWREGLRSTLQWYLDNLEWMAQAQSPDFSAWVQRNYNERAQA